MPSEHRLHPYSVLFAFLAQVRVFVLPGLLVALGIGRREGDWWEPWMMLLLLPAAAVALFRYLTYRYRFEETELVILTGLLFRRERHIPYARIQNIDAVQNPLHRLLGVVEVRIETGGGARAEASMSVLPLEALRQMRERVFAGHARPEKPGAPSLAVPPGDVGGESRPGEARAGRAAGEPAPEAARGRRLLQLDPRELLLCGFIENRGAVLIAAAFGLIWEFGVFDRMFERLLGPEAGPRGAIRDFVRGLFTSAGIPWARLVWTAIAFLGLLAFVRVMSMIWALVRLYGYTLTLQGGDVRSEFGLVTRVSATVPLQRVQSLTIRESPLHRWFSRVSLTVETAGGPSGGEPEGQRPREALAPILPRRALGELVATLVGVHLDHVSWQPAAPGAVRREIKGWLAIAAALSAAALSVGGWWAAPLVPLLVWWAALGARRTIEHLGWAEHDGAVVFRMGWLWRRVVIVPWAKIQVVARRESPFDRRWQMASIAVDAAGGSPGSGIAIPYVPRETAGALQERLAAAAAGTQFRW